MVTTNTATTNFNQTIVALVQKKLEELLRAPLPHLAPGNFRNAQFIKGTNNTMRFINIADMSVITGTPDHAGPTAPWLKEGQTPTAEALAIGYEEFSADQAGRLLTLTDVAMQESPFDLLGEAANRVARNAIATADKRVADVLVTGTNVIYAGGGSSSATVPAGPSGVLTGALVKLAVAKLAAGLVPTFGDGTYHAIIHPAAVYDLMSDTAVGGWVDAARYAGSRALMTGELGEYAGVRFQSSAAAAQKLATVGPVIATAGNAAIAATDLITTTSAHGLVAGNRIRILTLTGGAGLAAATNYYVVAPVTSTTFKVSATSGGAAIDITTDSSVFTMSSVADINSTTIFGPEAYAFGDWNALETFFTAPGGPGDELHQRSSVAWKGYFGAVIMGQGTNATGVTAPRYIRIESASNIS